MTRRKVRNLPVWRVQDDDGSVSFRLANGVQIGTWEWGPDCPGGQVTGPDGPIPGPLVQSVAALLAQHVAAASDVAAATVMHAWDASRPRSRKTEDAHAEGTWGVGPSDYGSCQKAIEYRERPPAGYTPDPVDKSAAIIGTVIHDGLTEARRAMFPWRVFKVPVLPPGLDKPGEADEYDSVLGRVTDYKTASDWRWERLGKDGPDPSEVKQILTYGLGLAAMGLKVVEVELLYLHRDTGQWESFVFPYSERAALAAVAELHAVVDALDAGHPLPRTRNGNDMLGPTVDTLCARYCPAVRHCWNLDDVPPHRTPEGFLLVREDDDGAIAATLTEYNDARTTESAGRTRKEYARALLEGLQPGRYGAMTLNWTGGKPVDKPDVAARAAQLESEMIAARQQARPPADPDTLPYPKTTKTSAVTIQVRPVRAAVLAAESGAA